ncbi:MAG: hypothetical protein WD532_00335, partial [Acidimicrobiia bacterium]
MGSHRLTHTFWTIEKYSGKLIEKLIKLVVNYSPHIAAHEVYGAGHKPLRYHLCSRYATICAADTLPFVQ